MPKIVDHDAQRAELLDGAFELFADNGYSATSMRTLAAGLGVSTGTLYHYFGNKEDIFAKMISRVSERDVSAATAGIPGDAGKLLRLQLIFAWICANEVYLKRMLLLIFDFRRHRSDAEAGRLVEQASQHYRLAFEEQVGETGPAWSLVLGMLVQGMLEPGTSDPQRHLEALERFIES